VTTPLRSFFITDMIREATTGPGSDAGAVLTQGELSQIQRRACHAMGQALNPRGYADRLASQLREVASRPENAHLFDQVEAAIASIHAAVDRELAKNRGQPQPLSEVLAGISTFRR
jgi:hypothetical protein